ncbi:MULTISPECIES: WxL protein peptidoglycan domain-containing protein [Actinosynnema]|uniref:WxL protein peptidoglycan domain-containing protein n=1 Tax=Actinosynnema TaxID=40566 RepID=UPI0020A370AF|nr:DUF916 domain-containing protein [Actinosynnema pretiosum]MCP2096599.1 protein of unknown function (DUF916) [Actinosynnema pretiosum]
MRPAPRAATLVVALLAALIPAPAHAQPVPPPEPGSAERQTWSVAPASATGPDGRPGFEYVVEPGMRYDDHLAVRNLGDAELTVDLYAGDAVNTDTGGFDLLARDEPSTSVGRWTTLSTNQVTVPPRQVVVVPFSLAVPADAEPGDRVGGVVAALTTGADVRVERRVGSRVYARVAGAVTPEVGVESLSATYRASLNPAGAGELDVTYTVVNRGNVRLTVRPSVVAQGLLGLGEVTAVDDALPELLPGNAITLTRTITGVWPLGPLDVRATAEPIASAGQPLAGSVEAGAADTTVWALSWTAIATLLLLAAILLALWHVRRKIRALRVAAAAGKP